jgi:hypothetical protein
MNRHEMQMLENARVLSGITDKALGGLTDDQIEQLENVETLGKLVNQMFRASTVGMLTYLATATPAGYTAASLFDTNEDPSNLKTIGTLLAGSIVSGAAAKVITSILGIDADTQDVFETVGLMLTMREDVEAALDDLVEANLISDGDAEDGRNAIISAFKTAKYVSNIQRAILGLASIACAYHGYRRNNDSIGYGLAWGLTNGVGIGVALKQGFAKPIN